MRNKSIAQFRRFYNERGLIEYLIDSRLTGFLSCKDNNILKVVYSKGIYYVTLYYNEKDEWKWIWKEYILQLVKQGIQTII